MKGYLLTPLAFAAFTLAVQAQQDQSPTGVPSVESVTEPVSDRAQNPDMDELEPVDEGAPDMDLDGMRTVDGDTDDDGVIEADETAPLDEGFTKSVDPAGDTYEVDVDDTDTPAMDAEESMNAPSEADPDENRWTDGDADGYDPVIDEVEQGAETAVKATGEALSTTKDAAQDAFDGDGKDSETESTDADPAGTRFGDADADGYDPVADEVADGAETAVKATGEAATEAADEVGEETSELFDGDDVDTDAEPDDASDDMDTDGDEPNR